MVKVNMEVFGRYLLQTQQLSDVKAFNTRNVILDQSTDINSIFDMFVDTMITQSSEFQERDTGWALEKIMYVEVNVNKYSPMGESSYIKLPKFIANKKAIVNIENQDQCCFAWAITLALHPAEARTSEISSYPQYSSVLNVTGMDFPVKLRDISKFEEMNNLYRLMYMG